MSSPFAFETASASHVGKVREVNEDSLIARPEIGLWAVADGMGGHGGGDVASAAVVAALGTMEGSDSAARLLAEFVDRMIRVNADLRALARARATQVIGTTIAAILIHGAHYACVWCGDSRAYRLRDSALTQISRDHSEVQDLVDRGILEPGEAKRWPRRNVITRALGVADQAALEIGDGPIMAGDRFLLCSDGLTTHVDDGGDRRSARRGRPAKGLRPPHIAHLAGAAPRIMSASSSSLANTRRAPFRADPSWGSETMASIVPDRGIGA